MKKTQNNSEGEKMKKVLVVIDYQNDFVSGSLGFNQSENIQKNIYALVANSVAKKDLIIFTKDTHYDDYLTTREGKNLPVVHCVKETHGHKLFGQLEVFETEKLDCVEIVEKETFGSEEMCDIIQKRCVDEPEVIEFCGVVTNICVLSNIVLAMTRFKNSKIVLHESACAAIGEAQQYALKILKDLGVEII